MEDNEQQKDEGEKEVKAPEGLGTGDIPKPTSIVEQADTAAERLEKAVEAQKLENNRAESIYAKQKLGGEAEAGHITPEKPEETPAEYAKRVMSGDMKNE